MVTKRKKLGGQVSTGEGRAEVAKKVPPRHIAPRSGDALLSELFRTRSFGEGSPIDCPRAVSEFNTLMGFGKAGDLLISPMDQMLADSLSYKRFLEMFLEGRVLEGKIVKWIRLFGFERFSAVLYDRMIEQVAEINIGNLFLPYEIGSREYLRYTIEDRREVLIKKSWLHFLFSSDRQRFNLLHEKAIEKGVLPSWDVYFLAVEFLMWSEKVSATALYRQMSFIGHLLKKCNFADLKVNGREHQACLFASEHFVHLDESVRSWRYKLNVDSVNVSVKSIMMISASSCDENVPFNPWHTVLLSRIRGEIESIVRKMIDFPAIEQEVAPAVAGVIIHLCEVQPGFFTAYHSSFLDYLMMRPDSVFWREQSLLEKLYNGLGMRLVRDKKTLIKQVAMGSFNSIYLLPEKFNRALLRKFLEECVVDENNMHVMNIWWVESMMVADRFGDSTCDHSKRVALAREVKVLIEDEVLRSPDRRRVDLSNFCGSGYSCLLTGNVDAVGKASIAHLDSNRYSALPVYLLERRNRGTYVRRLLQKFLVDPRLDFEFALQVFSNDRWQPICISRSHAEFKKGHVTHFDPLQDPDVVQAFEERFMELSKVVEKINIFDSSVDSIVGLFPVFEGCVFASRFISLWQDKIESAIMDMPSRKSHRFEGYVRFLCRLIKGLAETKITTLKKDNRQSATTIDHLTKLVLWRYLSLFPVQLEDSGTKPQGENTVETAEK